MSVKNKYIKRNVQFMTAWVVRAGQKGEDEDQNLEQGRVSIRFVIPKNLSNITDRTELFNLANEEEGELHSSKARINNSVAQIYSFVHKIQKNDFIVLPRKNALATTRTIAVGRVGPYEYIENPPANNIPIHHTRKARWLTTELLRSDLDEHTIRHINLPLTVFRIDADSERNILLAMQKRNISI